MQANIHPAYEKVKFTCSCGNVIDTRSTLGKDIHIEVCSKCHSFYTGKQKIADTQRNVKKFNDRYAHLAGKNETK